MGDGLRGFQGRPRILLERPIEPEGCILGVTFGAGGWGGERVVCMSRNQRVGGGLRAIWICLVVACCCGLRLEALSQISGGRSIPDMAAYERDIDAEDSRRQEHNVVQIFSLPVLPAGADFRGEVRLRSYEARGDWWRIETSVFAVNDQGGTYADLIVPRMEYVWVSPFSDVSIPVHVDWAEITTDRRVSSLVEVQVEARRETGGRWYGAERRIALAETPLQVSTDAGRYVPAGRLVRAAISWTNSLPIPQRNVVLTIEGPAQKRWERGASETLRLGDVEPGRTIVARREYVVSDIEMGVVRATVTADAEPQSNARYEFAVGDCPGDFNADTVVDDSDFVWFCRSYGTKNCFMGHPDKRCRCDINGDHVVDDLDFELFAYAAERAACAEWR